jgi:hypothetical protein
MVHSKQQLRHSLCRAIVTGKVTLIFGLHRFWGVITPISEREFTDFLIYETVSL